MRPPSLAVAAAAAAVCAGADGTGTGPGLEAAGCGAGAGAGAALGASAFAGVGAGAAAGAAAAATLPAASIVATTVLMGTVWPSLILISFSTPAEGDGISASTLSVEISKSGSSRSTLSPGFFSHLVIVPSKMLSPIWGITTSAAMSFSLSNLHNKNRSSVPGQLPGRVQHFFLVRQKVFFKRRRIRHRRIQSGDAHERAVEVAERAFAQNGGDFTGDTPGLGVFVHNQAFVGLLQRRQDRFLVERQQRAQINDFGFDAFFGQVGSSFKRSVHHGC